MREKYSFGWTDPRAMYGEPDVKFGWTDPRAMYGEPDVKWEFLEDPPWQPNIRPWLTVLLAYIWIRVLS